MGFNHIFTWLFPPSFYIQSSPEIAIRTFFLLHKSEFLGGSVFFGPSLGTEL